MKTDSVGRPKHYTEHPRGAAKQEEKKMTLKDYVKGLNEYLAENEHLSYMEAITSRDDEGNGYNRIVYTPSSGHYDEDGQEFESMGEVNAVCVN